MDTGGSVKHVLNVRNTFCGMCTGICRTAESIMTDTVAGLNCTSGLKSDVTVVFFDPDFPDGGIPTIREHLGEKLAHLSLQLSTSHVPYLKVQCSVRVCSSCTRRTWKTTSRNMASVSTRLQTTRSCMSTVVVT